MKKMTGIGIGITIILVAIIFGIASLSDEVLIKSPSIDTSKNPQGEERQITISPESISSNEQTASKDETPVEPENGTRGKVIEVKIKDGVGSGDR